MRDERYEIGPNERDTMRELRPTEMLEFYNYRRCPFCRTPSDYFLAGPRGGIMHNVECQNCRCRLNVIDVKTLGRWHAMGQLIREPIPGFASWQSL